MKGFRWHPPSGGPEGFLRGLRGFLGRLLPRLGHGALAGAILVLLGLLGTWIFLGLPSDGDRALQVFPKPEEGVPWALVQVEERGLSEEGVASVASALDRLGAQDRGLDLPALLALRVRRMALYLPLGDSGAPLGVFVPAPEDLRALKNRNYPEGWTGPQDRPFRGTYDEPLKAFRVEDPRDDLAGFLALEGERVLFARTPEELGLLREVLSGTREPLRFRWTVEPRWKGHLLLSDGGWLDRLQKEKDRGGDPLRLEAAWRSLEATDPAPGTPLGEAKWTVKGLSLPWKGKEPEALTWNRQPFSLAEPPVLALGANLPDLSPAELKEAPWADRPREWMEELGLPSETVGALLRGPVVLSLGGKTQVLWFDLPGFLADFPGRGEAGQALVDAVWTKLFLGAKPTPLEGYDKGGTTELPFSFLAAAHRTDALLGLVRPDGVRPLAPQGPPFGGQTVRGWGWLYADLPKLADTLGDLTALNELFEEKALENPFEEQAGDALRGLLRTLHPLLLVLERPDGGVLRWYRR